MADQNRGAAPEFTKYHALGNDYLVVDPRALGLTPVARPPACCATGTSAWAPTACCSVRWRRSRPAARSS
ncbi:hypothetical protein ACFQZC_37380 [Streptacidiphilus monticola]